MGKKRVGWLYGKPIVIGDKNLLTKNETHTEQLKASSDIIFYKIKEDVDAEPMLGSLMNIPIIGVITPEGQKVEHVMISHSSGSRVENPLIFSYDKYGGILGFKISRKKANTMNYLGGTGKIEIWELAEGDVVEKLISIFESMGISDPQLISQIKELCESTLEEITEEEYDKLK